MNQEVVLEFNDALVYSDAEGSREVRLPNPGEVSVVGLLGRDVVAGRGCVLERWSKATQQWSQILTGPDGAVYDLVAGDDLTGLVAFAVNGAAYFASTQGTRHVVHLETTGRPSALAVAPAAPVAAVAVGSMVKIYNLASASSVMAFDTRSPVRSVSFSPMGYSVAVLTADGRIVVWSLLTRSQEVSCRLDRPSLHVALHDHDPMSVSLLETSGRRRVLTEEAPMCQRNATSVGC